MPVLRFVRRDIEVYLLFQGLLTVTYLALPIAIAAIARRVVWCIANIMILSLSALGGLTLPLPTMVITRLWILWGLLVLRAE